MFILNATLVIFPQIHSPYVNYGFQHEERRAPPYAPSHGMYPTSQQYPGPPNPQYQRTSPSYPTEIYSPAQSLHQYTPQTAPVNTHYTATPALYHGATPVHKGGISFLHFYSFMSFRFDEVTV